MAQIDDLQDYVNLEMPRRSALLTDVITGYDGDPNLGGAPAILQSAPLGTWFREETAGIWWRKIDATPTGWEVSGLAPHDIGGSEHNADTLANLNSKVSDATLIDTGDSRLSDARTPTAHATSHSSGGSDPITIENLATSGAAGTVPVSDGLGGLTMGGAGVSIYATEAALLAASDSDGTIAYAQDTDRYFFRKSGAWVARGQFVSTDTVSSPGSGSGSERWGNNSQASGALAAAFGPTCYANASRGSAFGIASEVLGNDGSAFGSFSKVNLNQTDGCSFGTNAVAAAIAALTLGPDTQVTHSNGGAIGSNARSTATNRITVGRCYSTTSNHRKDLEISKDVLVCGETEHNQKLNVRGKDIELSFLSGSSATWANAIPAGSIVLGVSTRVTSGLGSGGGLTTWSIGDGTDVDRWGAGISRNVNTTTDNSDWTDDNIKTETTTKPVVLTPDAGTFSGGNVRITVYYIDFDVATS